MKRFLIFLTALLMTVSLFGCDNATTDTDTTGNSVDPAAETIYTTPLEIPTADEMRQLAVQAMRDLLSIQWTPDKTISYYNTAGRDKQFDYKPNTVYGGVLYSGSSSGLIHFMEFYDPETGVLSYPGDSDALRKAIGSGCADSLLWSWATVSNSFNCGYYPSQMVYKNGFLPVGDYTYNFEVDSFYNLPTKAIIDNNGHDVILEAYAKTLPADAMISSSWDHAIMIIENPTVVRRSDGTIDAENSFVYIQDQRGGTSKGFIEEKVDGKTVHFNSQRKLKMTFKELLEKNCIPVTIAEFTGAKEYDPANVTLKTGECTTLAAAKTAVIEANYPIAVIRLVGIDSAEQSTVIDRILIHSASTSGPAKTYDLRSWDDLQKLDPSGYKKIRVEVIVSTGQHFTPIDVTP